MLLAIDVGNTHVVLGLFRGEELLHVWRLESDRERTVDEFAVPILALLNHAGISQRSVTRVVLCCVVPVLTRVFAKLSEKYLSVEPLIIGADTCKELHVKCDDPASVGADRLANAVAARALIGSPCIIVDFGTATTFDVIGREGAYLGGAIAPGVMIAAEALSKRAALLPSVEIARPQTALGRNTRDSMLSGIFFGYVSLVDGLIDRLKGELEIKARVAATGGLARLIAGECRCIDEVVPDLTLRGLQIIADSQLK